MLFIAIKSKFIKTKKKKKKKEREIAEELTDVMKDWLQEGAMEEIKEARERKGDGERVMRASFKGDEWDEEQQPTNFYYYYEIQ